MSLNVEVFLGTLFSKFLMSINLGSISRQVETVGGSIEYCSKYVVLA